MGEIEKKEEAFLTEKMRWNFLVSGEKVSKGKVNRARCVCVSCRDVSDRRCGEQRERRVGWERTHGERERVETSLPKPKKRREEGVCVCVCVLERGVSDRYAREHCTERKEKDQSEILRPLPFHICL